MRNARENRGGVVDTGKSSQFGLKWAIENNYPISKPLKLVHVVQRSPLLPSNPGVVGNGDIVIQQEPDPQVMEVLLPYSCYCTRRQVQFEIVVLHDPNVTRALTNYVSLGGVHKLILGTLSRNSLSRRTFKNSDISSSVLKLASKFCDVYIISKGKVSATRHATARSIKLHDEVSVAEENDNLFLNSGRLSTDSKCFSFYENLESGLDVGSSSDILNPDNEISEPLFSSSKKVNMVTTNATKDFSCNEGSSFSWDHVEDEVRNLKLELKKAMELYHEACREARISKQKLIKLQDWSMKQEERLKEVELENARCKAAIEAEQRLEDEELEKKVFKEKIKADERHKVLDALSHSQTVLKY